MQLKKIGFIFGLLMMLLLITACGSSEGGETTTADKDNASQTGGAGGDLNIAVTAQPPTLDSHLTTATVAIDVTRNIFETLVAMDENHEPKGMLAESIDTSDDGKTYTFHLREGVLFHNGEEMTAEDVEASMNRWLSLSARAKMLLDGAEFIAVDDYTVELHLEEISAD